MLRFNRLPVLPVVRAALRDVSKIPKISKSLGLVTALGLGLVTSFGQKAQRSKNVSCEDEPDEPELLESLVRRLPCGLRVLDQTDWWDVAREVPTAGKLRALLQTGGATFYDAEGYFVKTPMVALVAVGGLPICASDRSLHLRLGDLKVPMALEKLRAALRSQMGMTAMFSYLNRRGHEPEEMWKVVAKLGHFSVGHTAHLSFVLVGHSCAVENEFNSQRDVVHLGRLTVARTRSQKDPPLVVQRPELLPVFKDIRKQVQAAILSKVAEREKMESKDISIGDWQEALYIGWPAAKAHVAILTGSLRNLQKLVTSIDDDGKETEYRALLWQIAVACHLLLPDMFEDPSVKFKWRPPPHLLPEL